MKKKPPDPGEDDGWWSSSGDVAGGEVSRELESNAALSRPRDALSRRMLACRGRYCLSPRSRRDIVSYCSPRAATSNLLHRPISIVLYLYRPLLQKAQQRDATLDLVGVHRATRRRGSLVDVHTL